MNTNHITDLINNAHREGFILIEHLVEVLAHETEFTAKHLPDLWKKFGCEGRRGPINDLSSQSLRRKRWFTLLYRIAFGFIDHPGANDHLSGGDYGKLVKKHIRGGDDYQPADYDYFKRHKFDNCYLKLDDLRDYLTGQAKIPTEDLPESLFSSVVTSEKPTDQRPEKTTPIDDVSRRIDQGKTLNNTPPVSNATDLKWSDITVTFISNTEILVQSKRIKKGDDYDYRRLGFQDQRSSDKPIGAWAILLEASKKGFIPWEYNNRKIVEKKAQEIRKKFRILFPNIDGNPVKINKSKANRCYKFAFNLKNNMVANEDKIR